MCCSWAANWLSTLEPDLNREPLPGEWRWLSQSVKMQDNTCVHAGESNKRETLAGTLMWSVNAIRNVPISLLNSSNQDREPHDEAVLSAWYCLLLSGDYRCLLHVVTLRRGRALLKANGQEVVKTSAVSQQNSTWNNLLTVHGHCTSVSLQF